MSATLSCVTGRDIFDVTFMSDLDSVVLTSPHCRLSLAGGSYYPLWDTGGGNAADPSVGMTLGEYVYVLEL